MPDPPQTDPNVLYQDTQAAGTASNFMSSMLKYAGTLAVPNVISGIMKMFVPGKPDPTAVALQAMTPPQPLNFREELTAVVAA